MLHVQAGKHSGLKLCYREADTWTLVDMFSIYLFSFSSLFPLTKVFLINEFIHSFLVILQLSGGFMCLCSPLM